MRSRTRALMLRAHCLVLSAKAQTCATAQTRAAGIESRAIFGVRERIPEKR
jgi:hypothetical protein